MSQSSPLGGRLSGFGGKIALPLLIEDAAEVDRAQLARRRGISWRFGHRRRCGSAWPVCTIRSYFRAASTSLRPSQQLWLSGVSTYTSLPAWQAQIAGQAVPMVGRGDHHGVDRLVVQGLAEVLHAVRRVALLQLAPGCAPRGQQAAVDVAQVGHAAVGPLRQRPPPACCRGRGRRPRPGRSARWPAPPGPTRRWPTASPRPPRPGRPAASGRKNSRRSMDYSSQPGVKSGHFSVWLAPGCRSARGTGARSGRQ